MTAATPRRGAADWSRAAAAALAPALDEAAASAAAEIRRRLGEDGAVTSGRDDRGRATLTVTLPGLSAREFGTRGTAAQPVLRPAVAAARGDMGRCLLAAVRRALTRDTDA